MTLPIDLKQKIITLPTNKLNGLYVKHNKEDDNITIINSSNELRYITIDRQFILFKDKQFISLVNKGTLVKGEISFTVAGKLTFLNSELEVPLSNLECFKIVLILKANTEVKIKQFTYYITKKSKFDNPVSTADTLIISPGYPSSANLYNFCFVHTSIKAFTNHNIKPEVFCHDYNNSFVNEFDGIKVYYNSLSFLKNIITNSNFKRVIIHFINEELQDIIDSIILYYGIKIYCYTHGAEILYRYQESFCMAYGWMYNPYVTPQRMRTKDLMYKKYANNNNIKWIFVSNWLKAESEKYINTNFNNFAIIPNGIDTDIFKYVKKYSNDRLNIFTLRKFDNYNNYALDIVIETITILQNKEFFNQLNFFIYGDGVLFKDFSEKIRLPNVHFIQGFHTHAQISELHKNCGIIFHPTRLDSMGVSSLEGVSSGLVLVSSNVCGVPEFINPSYGTLSNDIENPKSYANIIEDLFYNPDRFLELSEKMSYDVSSKFSRKMILEKELQLFQNEQEFYIKPIEHEQIKLLCICVPVYNIERYLPRCLNSILSCENKHLLEILVINDGSTDNTQSIAEEYQNKFPTIVTLINQSNKGHGGAVNTGIKHTKSKYFKIVDGDDWIDTQGLDNFLKYLNMFDVDLILHELSYDMLANSAIRSEDCYTHLLSKQILIFDQIKFDYWGPILSTSTYKTDILKKSNMILTEKCFYVDMEYNAKAIQYVKQVLYLDIPLYKYYIGRPAQSIAATGFKIHDHEKIILNILSYLQTNDATLYNKRLIMNKMLFHMLKGHRDRILQVSPLSKTNLEFFKKVKDINNIINWDINSHDISRELDNYLSKMRLVTVIDIKFDKCFSYIKLFIKNLLIAPYTLGLFTYKILNTYDIYYFNKYTKILANILMLPKKIASIILKR